MKMVDFERNRAIIARAKETLGLTGHGSDKKFAEIIDVDPTVLAAWKTRNAVDYEKLLAKLTPEQFIYATTGDPSGVSEPIPAEWVSRTEFLAQMLAVNKRVDELKASLETALRRFSRKSR